MPHIPSLADIFSSVFGWEGDEEDEEQRARAITRGMGFEASSIITGHCWANPSTEFLVCWRKVWGMRARNGQRRRRTSISSQVVIVVVLRRQLTVKPKPESKHVRSQNLSARVTLSRQVMAVKEKTEDNNYVSFRWLEAEQGSGVISTKVLISNSES